MGRSKKKVPCDHCGLNVSINNLSRHKSKQHGVEVSVGSVCVYLGVKIEGGSVQFGSTTCMHPFNLALSPALCVSARAWCKSAWTALAPPTPACPHPGLCSCPCSYLHPAPLPAQAPGWPCCCRYPAPGPAPPPPGPCCSRRPGAPYPPPGGGSGCQCSPAVVAVSALVL